jgi:hypothetical protein
MEIDLFGNIIVEEQEIEVKRTKRSPFDYTNDIANKTYPDSFDDYNPFLANASFSQRKDTVIYANELNKYHMLDKRPQFDFYYYSLPQKKYFAKWAKQVKSDYTDAIMWYFEVSYKVAKQYEKVLKKEQMESIKVRYEKKHGGKNA